jgi:putative Mg2+ transporter-C (MgtC) family protein
VALSAADVGHLAVAFALTYALGFERELRRGGAGDRVFSLIGLGTGLLGIIALHTSATALTGAITGIGFIGGGLVFRRASGPEEVIKGITTAAALFAAAGIGAAAGEGRLLPAVVATALAVLALEIRHLRLLSVLDARRWANRFGDDQTPVRRIGGDDS